MPAGFGRISFFVNAGVRFLEEHAKLRELMLMYKQKAAYNDGMASRYQAALTRLRKFEEAGPPPLPPKAAALVGTRAPIGLRQPGNARGAPSP